jgi:hypothetical protein
MKIESISSNGDKKNWLIQVRIRSKNDFKPIGGSLKIAGDEFKILDVIKKSEKKWDASVKTMIQVDVSEVKLQRLEGGDIITAVVGKDVYEPNEIVYLKNRYKNKQYKLRLGEKFSAGGGKAGTESFVLDKIVSNKKVIIKSVDTGDLFNVTKTTSTLLKKGKNAKPDSIKDTDNGESKSVETKKEIDPPKEPENKKTDKVISDKDKSQSKDSETKSTKKKPDLLFK